MDAGAPIYEPAGEPKPPGRELRAERGADGLLERHIELPRRPRCFPEAPERRGGRRELEAEPVARLQPDRRWSGARERLSVPRLYGQ